MRYGVAFGILAVEGIDSLTDIGNCRGSRTTRQEEPTVCAAVDVLVPTTWPMWLDGFGFRLFGFYTIHIVKVFVLPNCCVSGRAVDRSRTFELKVDTYVLDRVGYPFDRGRPSLRLSFMPSP